MEIICSAAVHFMGSGKENPITHCRRAFQRTRYLYHITPQKVVTHGRRLPGAVEAMSLEVLKARLYGSWAAGAGLGQPAHGRGWNWMGLKILSNPNQSMILWLFQIPQIEK